MRAVPSSGYPLTVPVCRGQALDTFYALSLLSAQT